MGSLLITLCPLRSGAKQYDPTAARGEGHLKGLTGPPVPVWGAGTTRLPQGPLASLGKGARGRRGSVITPNVQTDPESGLYS